MDKKKFQVELDSTESMAFMMYSHQKYTEQKEQVRIMELFGQNWKGTCD